MKKFQIYIGNDQTRDEAEMPDPEFNDYNYFDGAGVRYWNKSAYRADKVKYDAHLATLATHKVTGPHSWKVGQRLEEGVDFTWQKQGQVLTGEWLADEHLNENDYHAIIQDTRTVIIPLEGEQDDEDLRQIENDLVEALQYDNTVGTVIEYLRQNWQITRKK